MEISRTSILVGEVAGSIKYVASSNFIIFNATIEQLNHINIRHNTDIVKLALYREHLNLDGKIIEDRNYCIDGIPMAVILFNRLICKYSRSPLDNAIKRATMIFKGITVKGKIKLISDFNVDHFIEYCNTLISSTKYFGGGFIDMLYEMNTHHPCSSVNNITTYAFLNISLDLNNGNLDSHKMKLEVPTIQNIIDMIRKLIERMKITDYVDPDQSSKWERLLYEAEIISKSKWLN